MIEKIEPDNQIDYCGTYRYHYHDELARKINEIIDVVNQLDKRLQKMPEFYHVRAVGGNYNKN